MPVVCEGILVALVISVTQRSILFHSYMYLKPGFVMAMLIYTVFCYTNLSTVDVHLIDAHGGSAIFISPEINYTRRLDLSIDIPYCESVWAEIEQPYFTYNRKKQILASIYRSHLSCITCRIFISS